MCYDLIFPQSLSRYIVETKFTHSNRCSDFILQYHSQITIQNIIKIAQIISCGVKGLRYTDLIQDKEEIRATPMDFEDRSKKIHYYIFARNAIFAIMTTVHILISI